MRTLVSGFKRSGRTRDLSKTLKDMGMKLKVWNKATFGNIFKRKKCNELRLGGIQCAPDCERIGASDQFGKGS